MAKLDFSTIEGSPMLAVSLGKIDVNKTGSSRTCAPYTKIIFPRAPPAVPPANIFPNISRWSRKGQYEKAWRIILEDNPLPGVCGRVCYHPCEGVCNRTSFDEPIAIHSMERFVADMNFYNTLPMPMLEPKKDKRIAIIGSGPAGLACAYQLARRGYQVTMFEAHPQAGGMLRVGIPAYRLPREVLDKEINDILRLGVELRCGQRFGTDIGWEEIHAYDAVFIAVGAHATRPMGIPGEDCDEVRSGLGFLREISEGRTPQFGNRSVVIGGGNTAIDVARSLIRLGASVTIAYRRSRDEMPAVPEEVEEAIREGVTIKFLTAPNNVIRANDGMLAGLECITMELGEPDASGRRRPVPQPGSEFIIECDTIYTAIGESPDIAAFRDTLREEGGRLKVDAAQRTSRPLVFAGGDAATNPLGTVVDGIHSGTAAAHAIHNMLSGELAAVREGHVVARDEILTYYFKRSPRPPQPRITHAHAIASFDEVNHRFAEDAARREAHRCFSCGICNACDNCLSFCPDVAIHRNGDGFYTIDLDHCKGCVICVEECPREAMAVELEMK